METYCKPLVLAIFLSTAFLNPMLQTAIGQTFPEISFGGHILQVFPADHNTKLPWGPTHRPAGSPEQNNGQENTQIIIIALENWNHGSYAANICANLDAYGYTDWYLPSASEFKAMYQKRHKIGNLANAFYWTSTEDRWGGDAHALNPEFGQLVMQSKFNQNLVRCIRRAQKGEANPDHSVYTEDHCERRSIGHDQYAGLDYKDDFMPIGYINERVSQISLQDPDYGHIPVFTYHGVQSGIIKYNRTGIEQLRNYENRKDSYSSVLRAIALQPDFDASSLTNFYLPLISPKELLDDETLGFLANVVFSTTDFSISLSNQIAQMDLRYVKSVDGYTRALNKMKTLGRKLDGASLNNLSTALTYFSIITNSVSVWNDAAYLASSAAMINAAQIDMGLIRLHHLKSLNIMSDPAYNDALREVISELEALPESYWERLFFSIMDNQDKLVSGAISLANIATDISILINYNPISGWIKAGLFAMQTYHLITEWRENFRQLTCAATIYMNMSNLGERHYKLEDEEVMDYASLLYFRGMKTMTDNPYMHAWDFLDRDRRAFRIKFTAEYENVYENITLKRINRIMNCIHTQMFSVDNEITEEYDDPLEQLSFKSLPLTFRHILKSDYSNNPCLAGDNLWAGDGPYYRIIIQNKQIDLYMVWLVGCPNTRGRGQIVVFDDVVNQVVGSYFGSQVTGGQPEIELIQSKNDHYPVIRIGSGRSHDLTLESTTNIKNQQTGYFKDLRDNQTYKWVKIGNQLWMAENLNYTTGTSNTFTDDAWGGSNLQNGVACYENNPKNCEKYGHLYNFYVARYACPPGWHLPTKEDMSRFIKHNNEFSTLEEPSESKWNFLNSIRTQLAGSHSYYGGFSDIESSVSFWTSEAIIFRFAPSDSDVTTYYDSQSTEIVEGWDSLGISVRCVKHSQATRE